MGLRPNILSCIVLFLLVHYSYLCLYKGSLLYYIIHIIQYTDFQFLTVLIPNAAKYPQGRSFIQPSGTEDVVRVYAESSTQEAEVPRV